MKVWCYCESFKNLRERARPGMYVSTLKMGKFEGAICAAIGPVEEVNILTDSELSDLWTAARKQKDNTSILRGDYEYETFEDEKRLRGFTIG